MCIRDSVQALRGYARERDQLCPEPTTPAVLISQAGTRLLYCAVHCTFTKLRDHAGLRPRSATCRPRIHDVRHAFAVHTVLDWYRDDLDVQPRMPLLSTYLGHYAGDRVKGWLGRGHPAGWLVLLSAGSGSAWW